MADTANIKDFSSGRSAPQFRVDDEVYTAKRSIGLAHVQQIAAMSKSLETSTDTDAKLGLFDQIFGLLLKRESAERFARHLRDEDDPIPMDRLMEMVPWLLEAMGLRPTELSSASPDGSPDATSGTTSTDGAPGEGSTP